MDKVGSIWEISVFSFQLYVKSLKKQCITQRFQLSLGQSTLVQVMTHLPVIYPGISYLTTSQFYQPQNPSHNLYSTG